MRIKMSDKDDDEDVLDVKNIIIQNPIEIASISPIDHNQGSAENTDEEDPLEDAPLSTITSHIKMEIDIDER
ncbi:hypothetical protein HUJ04_001532 [Dendroctonus ponderosae]|nr:hypothetical protein HUJ04_001532 [Dendroctonus ponderosae]KAH1017073.1 hypothetical protein HUJ05_007792 [Dendroctonus ponderosae]